MSHAGDPGSPEAVLATLRERYRVSVHATLKSLEQLSEQLREAPEEPDVIDAVRREVHRLRGSAGSYGFHDLSRLAAALEGRLRTWAVDPSADPGERAAMVSRFAAAVRRDVLAEVLEAEPAGRVLLLVGVTDAQSEGIDAEGQLRGFRVERCAPDAITAALLSAILPRAILVPAALAARLPTELAVPVIVLTEPGSSVAVRAGDGRAGQLFVDADEPPTSLLDVVAGLASRSDHAGATIVVVDDDPTVLLLVRAIAEHDGLRVVTLETPDTLPAVLEAEQPAMLLMDVELGAIDGIETTRILRSSGAYRSIPIVLFSGTTSADVRAAAFAAGADDFFAKPLVAAEVQQRLQERLERRRWRRLVEGWHPIVDVATAARTAREGPAAWSAAPEGALALLYPAPGTVDASWIREVARLTTGLRDQIRFAGLLDSDALVLISSSGQSALAGSLRDARSPSATWHAGVVAHVAGMTWDATLTAAREALDVARRAVDRNVHEWVHEDSSIPPDVIIIEDDAALADMLEYALQMAGHTFQRFDDGRVALEALLAMRTGSHHPVILLDVDLPGLDGHSIHERLRVDRPGAFVVVFVSAHGGEGEQLRALNAGAWDYLTKPLSLRVLLAKLPVWLARSSATA